MQPSLDTAPVYPSLTQQPQLLGLPQTAAIVALGAILVFLMAVDFNLVSIGVGIATYILVLPFLHRAFEKEPLLMEIIPTYFLWPTVLPHHGTENRSAPPDDVPKSLYH